MNLQQIKMFIHCCETVLDLFSLFDHLKNLVHKSHSFMNHSTHFFVVCNLWGQRNIKLSCPFIVFMIALCYRTECCENHSLPVF